MFIPSVKPLLVELAPAGNEQKNNHVEKTKKDGEFSLLCGCEVLFFFSFGFSIWFLSHVQNCLTCGLFCFLHLIQGKDQHPPDHLHFPVSPTCLQRKYLLFIMFMSPRCDHRRLVSMFFQCDLKFIFRMFQSWEIWDFEWIYHLSWPLFGPLFLAFISYFWFQMDALISHSSKSYYACVGESTHAYQSPSKDLTVINNRLNGYVVLLPISKTPLSKYNSTQILSSAAIGSSEALLILMTLMLWAWLVIP